ncbi:MAG TPA: sugar phosphate nucleotidyltransferase [Xanthobacteraceae bacterium]
MRYAVILAGGKGTRLRPYTVTLPKPLVPIGDTPIIEISIRRLAQARFDVATLAINHMGDLIRAYFGDGEKFGVELRYSLEPEPLGTFGPLRLLRDLPEHFLVMNADVLTDLDLGAFLDRHSASGAAFTIAATRREQLLDFGVLGVEGERLVSFREKPTLTQTVSMGIYGVSRRALDFIPDRGPFGFDDLMHKMLAAGQRIDIHHHAGYWLDIGRPEDYEQASQEFAGKFDR